MSSLKHARDFRKVVESNRYRAAFPNVVAVRNTEHSFETTRGGGRLATSVGGTITGLGGNYIILDDPQRLFIEPVARLQSAAQNLVLERMNESGWRRFGLPVLQYAAPY